MKKVISILIVITFISNMGFKNDFVKAQNMNGKYFYSTKNNYYRKKQPRRPGIKNPKVGGGGKQSPTSSSSSSSSGGISSSGSNSFSGSNGDPPDDSIPPGGVMLPGGGGAENPLGDRPPPIDEDVPIPIPPPNIDCNFTSGQRQNETVCCRSQCMVLGNPGDLDFEICVANCVCEAHSGNGEDATECFNNCRANLPRNQYCANMADPDECCRATCISRNCPSDGSVPPPNIDCNFTSGQRQNETACCRSHCMALGNPGNPDFEICVTGCVCEAHSGNGEDARECFNNCEVNPPHNQYCANMADPDECCRATCISRNCPR